MHVLGYEGFPNQVLELTEGVGADGVYDGFGKETFDGSLASLRLRGTHVFSAARPAQSQTSIRND